MQLAERLLQRIEPRRPRLEQDDDLLLVGDLALPAVERPRAGKQRAAGDQPPLEQLRTSFTASSSEATVVSTTMASVCGMSGGCGSGEVDQRTTADAVTSITPYA